jgi:phosphopentomutase
LPFAKYGFASQMFEIAAKQKTISLLQNMDFAPQMFEIAKKNTLSFAKICTKIFRGSKKKLFISIHAC